MSSVGYNDNVTNAPTYPKQGVDGPVGDGFIQIAPTGSLEYSSLRWSYHLAYAFDARLNFTRPIANSYGNKLTLDGSIALDQRTDLSAKVSAKEGLLGVPTANDDASVAAVESYPTGLYYYLDVDATQSLSRSLTSRWNLLQDFSYSRRLPFVDATQFKGTTSEQNRALASAPRERATTSVSVGAEYEFPTEAIGPTVDVTFTQTASDRLLISYYGTWKHDFTAQRLYGFLSQVDLGVVEMFDPATIGQQILQPIAALTLSYDDTKRTGALTYVHTPKANVQTGQLSYVDSWAVRGSVPLDADEEYSISASTGYDRTQQINTQGIGGDPQHSFLFDGQVGYAPTVRELQSLRFSVRYTRRLQLPMPSPRPGFIAFEASSSNVIMFSFSTSWPSRTQAKSPYVLAPSAVPTGSTDVLTDSEDSSSSSTSTSTESATP